MFDTRPNLWRTAGARTRTPHRVPAVFKVLATKAIGGGGRSSGSSVGGHHARSRNRAPPRIACLVIRQTAMRWLTQLQLFHSECRYGNTRIQRKGNPREVVPMPDFDATAVRVRTRPEAHKLAAAISSVA
jgi:hypothetical protein